MVTSASIGSRIPEYAEPEPITARPLTRPTLTPFVTITSYSFFRSIYLSAICFSRFLANFLALITSFL